MLSKLLNLPTLKNDGKLPPYEKRMSKNHPKIIQKLSTHTEIIQKSSNSIQKIYNNCAKNCNNLLIEALQVLAQLLYTFCMEVDDFWMISVCVDNFWMIFGHSFFIGQESYNCCNITGYKKR